MREILAASKYTQIPQLTSSRQLDVHSPFEIVPAGCTGTKRAVIIGINYVGQQGELSGCHNDAHNMMEYIKVELTERWLRGINAKKTDTQIISFFIQDVHGFKDENITILMDDGVHTEPTRENILNAYRTLVA